MNLLLALPLANFGLGALPVEPAPALAATAASALASPPVASRPADAAPRASASDPEAQPPAEPDADADADAPLQVSRDETPPAFSEAEKTHSTADPLEGFNRLGYAISQPIDDLLLRPIALIYKAILPVPIRDGLRNVLANIFSPTVLANDVLQLRPHRALHTIERFAINSTLGLGGLIDMARRKPFKITPHPNGFSNTLGYYGSPPGPYIYLPVLGPTTVRDLFGMLGDAFTEPLLLDYVTRKNTEVVGTGTRKRTVSFFSNDVQVSSYGLATIITQGVDTRAESDDALQIIKSQSVDAYASLRSSYLQDRAGEIAALKAKDGTPAQIPAFDDPLTDPAAPGKP